MSELNTDDNARDVAQKIANGIREDDAMIANTGYGRHLPWGHRRYQVDYVTSEWWTEYATTPHEEAAKEIAARLLKAGRTVRISKTFECIEIGVPQSP